GVQIFDVKKSRFQGSRTDLPIVIEVDSDPSSSEEALRKSLAAIFVGPRDSLVELVPEYWQPLLKRINKDGILEPEPHSQSKPDDCTQAPMIKDPCRVGGQVKAPKAITAKDPPFSDIARAARLRGTAHLWLVVDEAGRPQNIRVVRPVGCG